MRRSRSAPGLPAPRQDSPARQQQHRGLQRAALLLWLVTTVALIAVALVHNRGGEVTCTGSWGTFCTGGTSAAGSPPVHSLTSP